MPENLKSKRRETGKIYKFNGGRNRQEESIRQRKKETEMTKERKNEDTHKNNKVRKRRGE
jgi:hypothetical protein